MSSPKIVDGVARLLTKTDIFPLKKHDIAGSEAALDVASKLRD